MKNNPEHHELCEMAEYERDEREHFALCFHINICILAQVPLFCLSIHLFYATHTQKVHISCEALEEKWGKRGLLVSDLCANDCKMLLLKKRSENVYKKNKNTALDFKRHT